MALTLPFGDERLEALFSYAAFAALYSLGIGQVLQTRLRHALSGGRSPHSRNATMNDSVKRWTQFALGRPFPPILLNILVTSVCDMRCTHCFFTEELDDGPRKKLQMKTREVENVSETLGGDLRVLILAGGEPFTRTDLPEIVRAFHRNNRLGSLYITSNGQIQKRIFPDVARILEECPGLNVTLALGIDGPQQQHDAIRQKPGSWEIVIDTARRLQAMKKEYPRLDVQSCTCFMHSNQDVIFEWYEFLKRELRPDKINFNYIRPPAADARELEVDRRRYAQLMGQVEQDSRSGAIKNHYAGEGGFFRAAIDVYMHKLIARTEETRQAQLRCHAGTAGGVIYDEGTVSSCENLPPVGNLRDYDWNFGKLWFSTAMEERRRKVADGCFCTHESNCYYPSLPFNPKHLVRIKLLETQMRRGWKQSQESAGIPV
jgi:MoaA/NifB/PqqE/SkfB family radical SAM enzyme